MNNLIVTIISYLNLVPTILVLHSFPFFGVYICRRVLKSKFTVFLNHAFCCKLYHNPAIANYLLKCSHKIIFTIILKLFLYSYQTVSLTRFCQFEVGVLNLNHSFQQIHLKLISCLKKPNVNLIKT